MQMPASSAALTIASPSIISVLPASTDSDRRARGLHRLDRRHADDRHVEPHVLIRLRDLDDAHAGAGELAGARDDRVGPLHRLDGDDGRRLHRDRLADVEAGDGVGDAVAEREVAPARSSSGARRVSTPSRASSGARNAVEFNSSMPLSRSASAMPPIRPSVFFAFSRISTPQQRQRRRSHDGEQLGVLDLPRHHRLRDAGVLEQLEQRAELPERNPVEGGRGRTRGQVGQIGERFVLERDDGDVVAGAARRVEDEEGKAAVPAMRPRAHGHACSAYFVRRRTSSARRDARRRMTPRCDVRMKSIRYCTSGHASD